MTPFNTDFGRAPMKWRKAVKKDHPKIDYAENQPTMHKIDTSPTGSFVLYFDAEREHFVLYNIHAIGWQFVLETNGTYETLSEICDDRDASKDILWVDSLLGTIEDGIANCMDDLHRYGIARASW